jgi:hypothetical protein
MSELYYHQEGGRQEAGLTAIAACTRRGGRRGGGWGCLGKAEDFGFGSGSGVGDLGGYFRVGCECWWVVRGPPADVLG